MTTYLDVYILLCPPLHLWTGSQETVCTNVQCPIQLPKQCLHHARTTYCRCHRRPPPTIHYTRPSSNHHRTGDSTKYYDGTYDCLTASKLLQSPAICLFHKVQSVAGPQIPVVKPKWELNIGMHTKYSTTWYTDIDQIFSYSVLSNAQEEKLATKTLHFPTSISKIILSTW